MNNITKLPTHWCVRISTGLILNYVNSHGVHKGAYEINQNVFAHFPSFVIGDSGNCTTHDIIVDKYTEISELQFKQFVLKTVPLKFKILIHNNIDKRIVEWFAEARHDLEYLSVRDGWLYYPFLDYPVTPDDSYIELNGTEFLTNILNETVTMPPEINVPDIIVEANKLSRKQLIELYQGDNCHKWRSRIAPYLDELKYSSDEQHVTINPKDIEYGLINGDENQHRLMHLVGLLPPDNNAFVRRFDRIDLEDVSLDLFGTKTVMQILQSPLLVNGVSVKGRGIYIERSHEVVTGIVEGDGGTYITIFKK